MSLTAGLRDPDCGLCPMAAAVSSPKDLCVIPEIKKRPDVLVVMKNQPSPRQLEQLQAWVDRLPGEKKSWAVTGAVKCISWARDAGKREALLCARTYLDREIAQVQPKLLVTMGNEALMAVTGRVGVTKYRGQSMTHTSGIAVYPTISPGMVKRNPGLERGFLADLRNTLLVGSAEERSERLAVRTRVVMAMTGLKALREALRAATGVAYDIESNGFDEYRPESRLVSISFTTWGEDAEGPEENWAVPLYHPESPWQDTWPDVLRFLMQGVGWAGKETSAHNGKFDCRWINEHVGGGFIMPQTFDTMLALHMLDESQPKGLKPAAQAYLGVEPWGIDTRDLLNTPLRQVLRYNGLDTWYTAWLTFLLRKQLSEQPRTFAIFNQLIMPASGVFTEIERQGIWVDRDQLGVSKSEAEKTLADIDAKLMAYVPADPPMTPNFNPSNFLRWWLFEHLGLPVIARGKAKEDGRPGDPSVAESVMLHLMDEYPHPVIELLLARTKWQKYTSAFFSAYAEQIDDQDRIHTTFKLSGTVTGRLSSGKGDAEKVTGRVQNRGVNLQQVPRDPFVRGIFGAPPGWVFVECDYSQVELRLAAYLAQEPTMLHLYATGQDIHTNMAQQMTGRLDVTGEERKKAKAVNFGFLYGMGANKFIETAWSNYGVKVSPEEARDFRATFFNQFPKLRDWHNKQRRLVSRFKRVESPIGRVRHLPDIDSADGDVKAEAQRQAINSPVQSFASDLCVLSLVRLDRFFRKKHYLTRSVGTVHDAINFEVPIEELARVVPIIRYAMENLPLREMFGVDLNVPIQADVKIGTRWGAAKEVPKEISCSPKQMREWMKNNAL